MSPFEPSAAAELFLELASETRCAILASLGKRPAKLSALAESSASPFRKSTET